MVDWQHQGHPRHASSPPRQRCGFKMLNVGETAQFLQGALSSPSISPKPCASSDKSLQELFHHLPSFFWGKQVMNSC